VIANCGHSVLSISENVEQNATNHR